LRAEWEALIQARPNVLLAGSPEAVDEVLAALMLQLDQPVQIFSPQTGTPLPAPSEGTLVLTEIAGLDGEQQRQLLRWLDDFDQRAHVQVVSTTSTRLFGLVESGDFLADLYYRLNVVRLDVATPLEQQS
jgi:hypothetical protein